MTRGLTMYFFAYGTLASGGLMAEKCPSAVFVSRAVLRDYRQTGLNVVPSKDSEVDGVLWEVDEECLQTLDAYENCPSWYRREDVRIYSDETGEVDATIYHRPG